MEDKEKKYDLSYNIMHGGSDSAGYQHQPSQQHLNKVLAKIRKKQRYGKGNNDNRDSSKGNIKLAGISKLKNFGSKNNSEKKKDNEKKAEHEAKKIADQIQKVLATEL
jgi:hypothetical protein